MELLERPIESRFTLRLKADLEVPISPILPPS